MPRPMPTGRDRAVYLASQTHGFRGCETRAGVFTHPNIVADRQRHNRTKLLKRLSMYHNLQNG